MAHRDLHSQLCSSNFFLHLQSGRNEPPDMIKNHRHGNEQGTHEGHLHGSEEGFGGRDECELHELPGERVFQPEK